MALGWQVEGAGPEARLNLGWRERGGPPVATPDRRGFGSMLIERSLRSYSGGATTTDYRPEGLVFEMDARMGDVTATQGDS